MPLLHKKRGNNIHIEAAHHTRYGYGPYSNARIAYVYVAGTMMLTATMDSMIILIVSAIALLGIYGWYPQLAAQQWFIYDQLFTAFSSSGLIFGALATALIFSRRSSFVALASATACTLSGAGVFVVSLVQPLAVLWQSLLYYFLPLFSASLAGTLLVYLCSENSENRTQQENKPVS